jgi:hypothetical protein
MLAPPPAPVPEPLLERVRTIAPALTVIDRVPKMPNPAHVTVPVMVTLVPSWLSARVTVPMDRAPSEPSPKTQLSRIGGLKTGIG